MRGGRVTVKIISGGQTGVDLAALAIAARRGLAHGGWVPRGRRNEAGLIPLDIRGLVETESADPAERTRLNAAAADATLILSDGSASPGTALTARLARAAGAPLLEVDLTDDSLGVASEIRAWLEVIQPAVLNIAGPRESEAPGVGAKAEAVLERVFGGG